jgi:hypothetical protein
MKENASRGPLKPILWIGETTRKQMEAICAHTRRGNRRQEAQMNHSIHSADRATHLKIVAVALVAGIAVASFGVSARTTSDYPQTAHVIKAGRAMTVTSSDEAVLR